MCNVCFFEHKFTSYFDVVHCEYFFRLANVQIDVAMPFALQNLKNNKTATHENPIRAQKRKDKAITIKIDFIPITYTGILCKN